MTMLLLQEPEAVLRQALWSLQPQMVLGRLVPTEETQRCKSLVKLCGPTYMGLKRCPDFASRTAMIRQVESLATYYTAVW